MPILSMFPGGSGSGGGGLAAGAVTGITTLVSSGKVYVKWTDPDDIVVSDVTLATWGGTLLVRKAGSMPKNRRDGTVVLDSTSRDAYKSAYFCDSGLSDGTTYYYKFFPYTTTGTYTDSAEDEFGATPTAQVTGIDSWNVTEMSASSEAGNGKMTVKWTDPANTIVSDEVSLATWASTTIVVKTGDYATSKDDTDVVYKLKVATHNQYSSTALTVTGLTNGTTYYISFFPETTDGGINTSTSQRTTGTANRITISTVPSQNGTLTYSGSAQSPSWNNYDPTQLTIGGTTSGTDIGSYDATFTPTDDYRWDDESMDAKTVSWSISEAISRVLNDNSWEDISGIAQKGNGANYWAVGDCKAITLNGTVGTLSISNATYYVYILGFNHNGSTGIDFGTFKTAATGGIDVCLVDSSLYSDKSDGTKIFNLNHWGSSSSPYNTNYGGWKGCDARYDILGSTNQAPSGYGSTPTTSRVGYDATTTCATSPVANTLMAALPSDLRAVMQPMTIYTDSVGNASNVAENVTASVDYLPLLAEFEIFGSRSLANQYEQNNQRQYAYYSSGNSKVKYEHSNTGSSASWWGRSAYYYGASYFCRVNSSGNAINNNSRSSVGLAPAFRV